MIDEILNAIAEFKKAVEKKIQENMEEMPYFNRSIKNGLMDRLSDIFQSYRVNISINKIEELVDSDVFPIMNEFGKNKLVSKSEELLSLTQEFAQELTPNGEPLPQDELGKERLIQITSKFMNSSEESRRVNIDFTDMYDEIIIFLKDNHLFDMENFDLVNDIRSAVLKTQNESEEHYNDKVSRTFIEAEHSADNIYQRYLQLINEKINENQPDTETNYSSSPFI